MSGHAGDGRDPQGSVDRALRRGAPGLVVDRARTSPWRRSTPAWSTPAATGRGCSPAPARAGSARRCGAPTTSARPGRRRRTAPSASRRTPTRPSPGSGSSTPGAEDDVVYAGTEPGAIFKSTDRGETFELERGAVGQPAAPGVERRLRRPGVPHDPAAPRGPASRCSPRSPPAASTAPTTAATPGTRRNTGREGGVPARGSAATPSSASACTR